MANLAGLGIIYNNLSGLNQQYFQLLAVPGNLSLVMVDGVLQNPDTYTIDKSVLKLDNPLPQGKWIFVISGQGGTFVPQSYVDDNLDTKVDSEEFTNLLNQKISKTGGDFTGSITVQEPSEPMEPVTLQMFETLPEMASQEYVEEGLGSKVSQEFFDAMLDNLVLKEEKGNINGVTENDEYGKIKIDQIPLSVMYSNEDISISGDLVVNSIVNCWREKYQGIVTSILIKLGTAPTGSSLKLNLTKNGVGILDTNNYISIPVNTNVFEYEFQNPPTFETSDYLGIKIEAVGSTVAGANLSVRIETIYLPD